MIEPTIAPPLPETHFALSVEPALPAAPGTVRHLRYRASNTTSLPVPAALVQMLLPPGVEALAPPDLPLPPLAPGETAIVELAVRLARPLADGTALRFQAALALADADPLGSNCVTVCVMSRARFDASSRLLIEATERPDEVIVAAELLNTGDDVANGWRLELHPPLGTLALEPALPFMLDGLAPGESRRFSLRARIVDPPGPALIAADAVVFAPDETPSAIPASDAYVLAAQSSVPQLACTVDGRRIDVRVTGANLGYAPLRDAVLTLAWPARLRCADASIERSGSPLALRSKATSLCAALPVLAPGERYEIACSLFASGAVTGGEIEATVFTGESQRAASVTFARTPRQSLTVRAVERPAIAVDAGSTARITFEVANDGDMPRTVTCTSAEATLTPARFVLAPGARKRVSAEMTVAQDTADGAAMPLAIALHDGHIPVATCEITLSVRNRVWFDLSAWLDLGDEPRIVLVHRGATDATGLTIAWHAGGTFAIGTVAAGTTSVFPIGDVLVSHAARGGILRDGDRAWPLPALSTGAAAGEAYGSIETPPSLAPARAAILTLRLNVVREIADLALHVTQPPALTTLAGSTRVNGLALADHFDGPVLHTAAGLGLHRIPAGTSIEIAWSVVADGGDVPLVVHATAIIDGAVTTISSEPIGRERRSALHTERADLPFHIDGIALERPVMPAIPLNDVPLDDWSSIFEQPLEPLVHRPTERGLRLDAARSALMTRMLGTPGTSAASGHLFALRALAPDPHDDDTFAMQAWRDAVADVFDRLYVKLRIPGYVAGPDEWEDGAMRRAIEACDTGADLAGVPLGAARALAAHAGLLATKTATDTSFDAALTTYVHALRDALAAEIDLERTAPLLDDTRAAVLAASMRAAA